MQNVSQDIFANGQRIKRLDFRSAFVSTVEKIDVRTNALRPLNRQLIIPCVELNPPQADSFV